jgi:hypothetical protein
VARDHRNSPREIAAAEISKQMGRNFLSLSRLDFRIHRVQGTNQLLLHIFIPIGKPAWKHLNSANGNAALNYHSSLKSFETDWCRIHFHQIFLLSSFYLPGCIQHLPRGTIHFSCAAQMTFLAVPRYDACRNVVYGFTINQTEVFH